MARLETYQQIEDSYINSLNANAVAIGEAITKVSALKEQLRVAKLDVDTLNASRQRQVAELRGLRSIIQTIEDNEIAARREAADKFLV